MYAADHEVLDLGILQGLCPPLLVVADREDRVVRCRMRSAFPPVESKFLETPERRDDIIDHVNDTAFAILRISQRDHSVIEVDIAPLQAVLLALSHSLRLPAKRRRLFLNAKVAGRTPGRATNPASVGMNPVGGREAFVHLTQCLKQSS